ncbi:MAG: ceramidase domain-containing protein [Myxococcota bacterium]
MMTRGWFWTLAGGAGGVLAVLALAAGGWPGFHSDGCRAAPYPGCYCEEAASGLIAQPINTWSSLAFVVVGLFIALRADRKRNAGASSYRGLGGGLPMVVYAVVVSLLGPGSMFKHASLTHEGGLLDIASMYLFGTFIWSHALARTLKEGAQGMVRIFVGLSASVFAIQVLIDPPMTPFFGVLIVGFIFTEVWAWTQRERGWTMDVRHLGAAFAIFAAALAIWVPSMTGGVWCMPDSLFQGHAAWHVLCALATGSLYRYFASIAPGPTPGQLSMGRPGLEKAVSDGEEPSSGAHPPEGLGLRLRIVGRGLVLGLTLVVCELGLRSLGSGPWQPFSNFEDLPVMSAPHPQLGWVNRPGSYRYPLGDRSVEVEIGPAGGRGERDGAIPDVGLFGGSFVFGFGLSDREIVSAELERLRPELHVANYGVPGFGTLQATERYAEMDLAPPVVVYGLVELHEARNVGSWSWLHALDRARRGHHWVATPAARWDGEELRTLGLVEYHHWAWSETSALVDLFERARVEIHDRTLGDLPETTVQLILRFRKRVEARQGRFVVALLDAPRRAEFYLHRLAEEGVEVVDLRHPRYPAEWKIPGDGHPDARVHRDWAKQLAESL